MEQDCNGREECSIVCSMFDWFGGITIFASMRYPSNDTYYA